MAEMGYRQFENHNSRWHWHPLVIWVPMGGMSFFFLNLGCKRYFIRVVIRLQVWIHYDSEWIKNRERANIASEMTERRKTMERACHKHQLLKQGKLIDHTSLPL